MTVESRLTEDLRQSRRNWEAAHADLVAEQEAHAETRAELETLRKEIEGAATAWLGKAAWLQQRHSSGVGAVARANAYRECSESLRALSPSPSSNRSER